MNSKRIKLRTALTPADCVSRLAEVIDTDGSLFASRMDLAGSKPLMGRLDESSLFVRKRIGYRNSFQSLLKATIRPDAAGPVISGKIMIHPFIQMFMFAWFLISGTMLIMRAAPVLGLGNSGQNTGMAMIIPLFMLVFGIGLILFGRHVARDEAPFLIDVLIRTLDARGQKPAHE